MIMQNYFYQIRIIYTLYSEFLMSRITFHNAHTKIETRFNSRNIDFWCCDIPQDISQKTFIDKKFYRYHILLIGNFIDSTFLQIPYIYVQAIPYIQAILQKGHSIYRQAIYRQDIPCIQAVLQIGYSIQAVLKIGNSIYIQAILQIGIFMNNTFLRSHPLIIKYHLKNNTFPATPFIR